MITSIKIKSIASYGEDEEVIKDLKRNNFFYGANGSGKTTISRVMADEDQYPDCKIDWDENKDKLPISVYNRDFIDKNFNPDSDLKVIFTFGENNKKN